MEKIQLLKYCPWISEKINIKEYFEEYHKTLDEANGMNAHQEEVTVSPEEAIQDFFHLPDDFEMPFSRRSTPALSTHASIETNTGSKIRVTENVGVNGISRSRSADDYEHAMIDSEEVNGFSIEKMESDCSVDLLNVDGELPPRDLCDSGPVGDSGRVTNWYAGKYMDGVIPDGGPDKLVTLGYQSRELYKRETVKDYTRLRHRLLKYASTVRMVMKKGNAPENIPLRENMSKTCLKNIILNVRVQRPYHKKSYAKKGVNRYPKHSQEMYLLGSQKLTTLRDAVTCINDMYIHEDMSENPDLSRCSSLPSSMSLFPSAFFFINGVFYSDMRDLCAKDNSETLRNWAKRHPTIGEMVIKKMDDVTFNELELRLGYPYVFQHLGNCEHLITFTDVRLHHRTDIQDPSRYPLSRGNPIKLAIVCYACELYLAHWILKDNPRIPVPFVHLCDTCRKLFFYDDDGRKTSDFKLFPFFDEFSAEKAKEKTPGTAQGVEIRIGVHGDDSARISIEPLVE